MLIPLFRISFHFYISVRRPRLKAKATTEGIEHEEYEDEDNISNSTDDEDEEDDSDEHQSTEVIVSLPTKNQVKLAK